ncbi:hypothetical protein [Pseudooctadecabacter sp.]|uniref:hypothetical protein n=1 Tax=Pseudooctadecabacter sp. TaxID=1966338 RepID=UPI0035C79A5E
MAERHRSTDGTRETEAYTSDLDTPSHAGRDGGDMARRIATKDEEKRRVKGDTSVTRVTKKYEKGEGNLGGHHGTDVDAKEKGSS